MEDGVYISSSTPFSIKTIKFTENGVICEYLNSYGDREEEVPFTLFKANGYECR